MLKTGNLFAFLFIFVLAGVAVKAQNSAPRIERDIQVFTDSGGSYLGVETQEITKENFSKFGLKEVRGVALEKVLDNSPAKQAGLQDGDVIVRFNGEEITSFRKLTRLISETAPDHQAKLTVVRGGSEREFTVTMGKRPTPKFEMGDFQMTFPDIEKMNGLRLAKPGDPFKEGEFPMFPPTFNGDVFVWRGDGKDGNFVFGSTRQIGVGVAPLTKQLGDYFGVTDGKGILINNVNENSPAAKAGLKAGDVIVEVEGKAVGSTTDLIRGIAEKKEGEVTLTIVRNKNRQTVKVTPEKLKEGEMPFRTVQPGNFSFTPGVRFNAYPRMRVNSPVRMVTPGRVTKKRIL